MLPIQLPMEETYARAVETLGGLKVPERAQWIRVMVLEMSRIAAHLFMVGGHHAATLGLYTSMFWGVALRDLLLDRFEELTSARIYHMHITMPGGVRRDLPGGFLDRLAVVLDLCIGCGTYAATRDNHAIHMVTIPDLPSNHGTKSHRPAIDYGRCCCWCCVPCAWTSAPLALLPCRGSTFMSASTRTPSSILPDKTSMHHRAFPYLS
ncbi:MAG: NADH-quinone oxidoreductase subunit D [Rhodospirillaceae bacterium]|nr:MAG: NADH-quinone oxidoreductase subunit D [Rhodospirillaceae bacterium]